MNKYNMYVLPPQKLSMEDKTEEWGQRNVDAIINMASSTLRNGRTSKQEKQTNYDLFNSIVNEEDFDYVLNPYGLTDRWSQSPVKMQNYNIIRSKIELLKGEEMKRPFKIFARATAGDAVNRREEKRRGMIQTMLTQMIQAQLSPEEAQAAAEGQYTPEIITRYMNNHIDPVEKTANQIMEYVSRQQNLEMKFNQGWEHALVVAEEIYYVGIVNGEVVVRLVNPLNFEYEKDEELKFLEDAQWCREERWMSTSAVLDTFGEYLKDKDVERLDEGQVGFGMNNRGMQQGFVYQPSSFFNQSYAPEGSVYVANVCWKSMRKLGFLAYPDPKTGEPQETIVDEGFKLTPELKKIGATLEWRWINEVWEGTRIGDDIYVNVRPLPNQQRSAHNPSECKLPYTGYVYNNTNSKATSIVDLVKPHQYTYMIVWYRLEHEIAKAKGKKFVMDIAQLPKSQGWTVDQWMHYFEHSSIAWINSMEEGREGDPNSISKFNQFTNIDMALSQVVSQYMEILNKLEQQVSTLTGVSPQREAQTSPSETATGVERAVIQSSHITEPYFYYHNQVKQQVFAKIVETAKIAYADGFKRNYVVDDVLTATLNVDGEELNNTDLGVFITNSAKDHELKQKLESLAEAAMSQGLLTFTDIVRVYKTNSMSEMEAVLAEGEDKRQQQSMQETNANNEAAMKREQMIQEREDKKLEVTKQIADDKNATAIEVAQINAMKTADGPTDTDSNGIADPLEIQRLQQEAREHQDKMGVEQGKLRLADKKIEVDKQLGEKKIKADAEKQAKEVEIMERKATIEIGAMKQKNQLQAQADTHKLGVQKQQAEIQTKAAKAQGDVQLKQTKAMGDTKIKQAKEQTKLQAKAAKYKMSNKPKPKK